MSEKDVINSIHNYLLRLQGEGISISFGVLYGSYALGNQTKWSDIDLLVVSPQFDGLKSDEDIDLLWYMAALVDSRIEPIACGLQQWLHDDESTIIEVARREGLIVRCETDLYVETR